MLCLAVRSPSSMITAIRSKKPLIYGALVEYITVWFQIVTLKVQTFARKFRVCAKKSFRCLVVEQPPVCCRLLREGGYTRGPECDFPLRCAFEVVRRLMELCDTMETSANAAGEVRVSVHQ